MTHKDETDFGFSRVAPAEKTRRVRAVFESVAPRYDLMNDLMSAGLHRLWKRQAVNMLDIRPGHMVLDLAGGTGDMTRLMRINGSTGRAVSILSDINAAMLTHGRDRLLNEGLAAGIDYVQADAESLPFRPRSLDRICIAFGLRNVTDKVKALRAAYEALRFGGLYLILEFSQLKLRALEPLYDAYSFQWLPWLGQRIAGDADSYRYLAESIRRHPDQNTLSAMLQQAGFDRVDYTNLAGGIVAVHRAWKI
ncbi:MAG: class I SAM-dependent methyltransferase [Gammaproteobacteria bacterium]|nr:class I SAM-dependent methyltransferase [Gammaproteobacteria bacterium]